ncbi:MAG: phosphatidate cytidylyltransferase [Gammaproteobacteria bacterium]|nr:phosphatidate cytidylyltransferase [Gammaproteobacteria bacterium]
MLLKRFLTSLVLGPSIIAAVILLPGYGFAMLWGFVILLGAWEWTNLAEVKSLTKRILYVLGVLLSILFFYFWKNILEFVASLFDRAEWLQWSGIMDWWAIPVIIFWLVIGVKMKRNPTRLLESKWSTESRLMIGWIVLVFSWMFLRRLDSFWDWQMTLYFLLLIWIADVAAYFVGKRYGKEKLLPEISPGKTVAGLYGALFAGLFFSLATALYYNYIIKAVIDFAFLSLVTIMFSVNGDLLVSLMKRIRGVKDTGNLLPGHGGILDRIDGILAAAPVFYIGLVLLHRQYVG